jgi:hypothetical protein
MECCGYEALTAGDNLFLLEYDKNFSNVTGCMFTEKWDYEELKAHVIKSTQNIHRGRSRLTKIFGEWFFKTMSEEEFERNNPDFVTRVDNIKTND